MIQFLLIFGEGTEAFHELCLTRLSKLDYDVTNVLETRLTPSENRPYLRLEFTGEKYFRYGYAAKTTTESGLSALNERISEGALVIDFARHSEEDKANFISLLRLVDGGTPNTDRWIELRDDEILRDGDVLTIEGVHPDKSFNGRRSGFGSAGYLHCDGIGGYGNGTHTLAKIKASGSSAHKAWRLRDKHTPPWAIVAPKRRNLSNKNFSQPLPLP